MSPPALRAFFRIAELWQLSVAEQMTLLGITARSTFFKWKKHTNVELPKDTLERISYLLGYLQGAANPSAGRSGRGRLGTAA